MQRAATELAYLRDAMTRGLVDDAGLVREKFLLARLRELRGERRGRSRRVGRPTPRFRRRAGRGRRRTRRRAIPDRPAWAATIPRPGHRPPPVRGGVPLGQTATQYSEVDPSWKPPGE